MTFPRIILTISLYLVACAVSVFAQHLNFKNYGLEDGLPQQQVLSILQDSKGYMWFGTYGGVSRFNGVNFKTFDTSNGLRHNLVWDIAEDSEGNIYFATNGGGLAKYDGRRFQYFDTDNGLISNNIYDIHVDDDRTVWVASDGGLSFIRGNNVSQFVWKDASEDWVCRSVYRSLSGDLWIGTSSGLFILKDNKFNLKSEDLITEPVWVLAIIEDLQGRLWIGTSRGLYRLEKPAINTSVPELIIPEIRIESACLEADGALWFGTSEGVLRFSNDEATFFTTLNGLPNNLVHRVYIDNEQNIWFGTFFGVCKLRKGPFIYHDDNTGLNHNSVTFIYEDSKQRLWIATWGGGITVLEQNKSWSLTHENGLPDQFIMSVVEEKEDTMLIATDRTLCRWDGQRITVLEAKCDVTRMLRDSLGRIWAGTGAGLYRVENNRLKPLENDSLLSKAYIYSINEDDSGKIWCGVRNGCIVYNGNKSTHFGKEQGFTNQLVASIDTDPDGKVWIGTMGDGAFCYDGETTVNFTTAQGLSNNFVWQVIADSKGNVWFGTNSGTDVYNGKTFEHFDVNDGLASNEGSAGACLEDSRGQLWFGSAKGLSLYVADKSHAGKFRPPVYIERFMVNSEPVYTDKHHELSVNEYDFEFQFVGLSYRDEEKVRYRYMLEGLERDWSEATLERHVRYNKVPPGNYLFKVQAATVDGFWSETSATVSFTILPPFYQTTWFIALMVISVGALIVVGNRLVVRKVKADKLRLEQIVRDRTREISAANEELKAFSYSVSHDLRTPLRHIDGFSKLLVERNQEKLEDDDREHLNIIRRSVKRMGTMIDALLKLSRVTEGELRRDQVDMSLLAYRIACNLKEAEPDRTVEFVAIKNICAECDGNMISLVLENLLANAWKFTKKQPNPRLEFGLTEYQGKTAYFVKDNGVGFNPEKANQLFAPFLRLHQDEEFKGTGIGLATVRRIIHRHGGRVWAEAEEGKGATFYFTLN